MDQLRAMRTFARVVDEGSFAAAARALDIAPAAATRTIADLENHLGARLMTRTTRRLALTGIGQRYLERARAILHDIDEAAALVSAAHAEARGELRIVAPGGFALRQLGPRLARFHAAHPRVSVDLAARDRVQAPEDGRDISIVVTREPLDGEFVARPLARSEVIACALPALLDRIGRPQHPSELAARPLLLAGTRRGRALTFMRRGGGERVAVTPAAPVLATDAHTLNLAGAMAGLGIAGLPSYLVDDELRVGRLERVLPDWRLHELSVWACMPSRRQVPASTRAFMDFLATEFPAAAADPWQADPCARPKIGSSPPGAPSRWPSSSPGAEPAPSCCSNSA